MKRKFGIVISAFIFVFITLLSSKVQAQTNELDVQYSAHVQNIGWQQPVQGSSGNFAGTTGQSLRIEAIKAKLINTSSFPNAKISYQAHVQNIGWMSWKEAGDQDNDEAGTTGQSLRLEAIRMKLEGASGYHIEYQAWVQNIGWMNWVKGGDQDENIAGTIGKSLRIEAIRIKIVNDNTNSVQPPQPSQPIQPTGNINVNYQTQVQNIGWMNTVSNMAVAGTVGQNLRLETIKISSDNLPTGTGISYQAKVEGKGWMPAVQNGQQAGTVGQGLKMNQIKMNLSNVSGYHIQYQVQVENMGWTSWAQDGAAVGSPSDQDWGIQAIRIRIVKDLPQSASPNVQISTPGNGTSFYDNQVINLSGTAVNNNGIQEIDVYSTGTMLGKATITANNGSQVSYSFSVAKNTLCNGNPNLEVEAVGKDAQIVNTSINVNYKVLQPMMCIDDPDGSVFIKDSSLNTLNLRGWAIGSTGIQKVSVFVDNKLVGNANYGTSRPDVKNAYPVYQNADVSGFTYALDTTGISNGNHNITVTAYDNAGKSVSQNIPVMKLIGLDGVSTKYNISLSQLVNKQMATSGANVVESGNNWVPADMSTVEYYADPNNFLNNYGIYQFMVLNYEPGVTVDDVNKMLSGKGVLDGHGAAFLQAAEQNNISVFYLVSHALLETGNGTSRLATGINVNGTTVYNMYGIGAYDSNPNYYGSLYAYNKGWTSVDGAITGGASWVGSSYINSSTYNQNTLYKMRWNPADTGDHQYATDVKWAYNQIYNIKKLIDMCTSPILKFDIPVFN